METVTTINPKPFNVKTDPLKVLPDQHMAWIDFGKDGVSFDEAANRVVQADALDGNRVDLGVGDLSTWVFGPMNDGSAAITPIPVPGRPANLVPLRQNAFKQLCARVGAPAGYIEKLPGALQIACVNHGLQRTPAGERAATLRLANGAARAVVSDRYAALDNAAVLDTLRSTLVQAGRFSDVRVKAAAVGNTMALRLAFPGDAIQIKVGDVVETGIDVTNGEIGNRSLAFMPVTYRLVCLNGMRRSEQGVTSRLRHVGDPGRLHEAFRDALPVALVGAAALRDRMTASLDRVVGSVLDEIDGLSAFGLRANEVRAVAVDAFAERGLVLPADTDAAKELAAAFRGATVFDVANAVTHFAQTRDTDRRLELEEAAAAYTYRRTA